MSLGPSMSHFESLFEARSEFTEKEGSLHLDIHIAQGA